MSQISRSGYFPWARLLNTKLNSDIASRSQIPLYQQSCDSLLGSQQQVALVTSQAPIVQDQIKRPWFCIVAGSSRSAAADCHSSCAKVPVMFLDNFCSQTETLLYFLVSLSTLRVPKIVINPLMSATLLLHTVFVFFF